jgi:hypothetical protein
MPANDPYFGNVALLLHLDDYAMTDRKGKTVSKYGNVIATSAQKKWGAGSAYFDGNGDYLQVAASADWFFGTGAFTIECWVYIAANSATDGNSLRNAQLWTNMSASYGGFSFQIAGNGSTTGTGIGWEDKYGGSSISGSWTTTVSQGEWHHVAVCREAGSADLILCLDGTVQTSAISGGSGRSLGSPSYAAQIGGQPAVANWTRYLNGYIDDFRITLGVARYTANYTPPAAPFPDYGRYVAGTLTEATPHSDFRIRSHRLNTGALLNQIAATGDAYEVPCCPESAPYTDYADAVVIVAHPRMGSNWKQSTIWTPGDYAVPADPVGDPYVYQCAAASADAASLRLAMTMEGANTSTAFGEAYGLTMTAGGNAQIKTDQYKFGSSSGYFDGSGDYVRGPVAPGLSLELADFTLECWVRPVNLSVQRTIWDTRAGGTDTGYCLYVTTDGKPYLYSLGAARADASAALNTNAWNHIAVVRSSGIIKIYVNGVGGSGGTYPYPITAPGFVNVGADLSAANGFYGHIDQLLLFVGIARYTADFTPSESAFVLPVTGSSEPAWPTNESDTVEDGGLVWTCIGRMIRPVAVGPLIPSL